MSSKVVESWIYGIPDLSSKPFPFFVTVLMVVIFIYSMQAPDRAVLNPKRRFELTDTRPKKEFMAGIEGMLRKWFESNPDKPARVIGDLGVITVLPPNMANEIRNDERLSFTAWTDKVGLLHIVRTSH